MHLEQKMFLCMRNLDQISSFDRDTLVAYVVQGVTTELESEEQDVIIQSAMTGNKFFVKTNLGQLLAGMEKVAGDIASMHIHQDIPFAKMKFKFIHLYGILVSHYIDSLFLEHF